MYRQQITYNSRGFVKCVKSRELKKAYFNFCDKKTKTYVNIKGSEAENLSNNRPKNMKLVNKLI